MHPSSVEEGERGGRSVRDGLAIVGAVRTVQAGAPGGPDDGPDPRWRDLPDEQVRERGARIDLDLRSDRDELAAGRQRELRDLTKSDGRRDEATPGGHLKEQGAGIGW